MVKENLLQVQENIRKACEKSGRSPEEVTLIARRQGFLRRISGICIRTLRGRLKGWESDTW